jgi:hypothetical protein
MSLKIITKITRAAGRYQTLRGAGAVASTETRTFVTATNPLLEKYTIKVPSMGDSITEVRGISYSVLMKCCHYVI